MPRPIRHAFAPLVTFALAAALPAAAQRQPHPALTTLVPLVEVYAAEHPMHPGFDVAAIRCAALTIAQEEWAARTPGFVATDRRRQDAAMRNLRLAEIDRRDRQRLGVGAAASATRADMARLRGLYAARFDRNQRDAGHPWRSDRLIDTDTTYCGFLNDRPRR